MSLITLKFGLKAQADLHEYQRIYSSIFRSAYQGFRDKKNQKEIRALLKSRFPSENSWLVQSAITDAQGQHLAHQAQAKSGQRQNPVIWGGRGNLKLLNQGKISKQDWRSLRLRQVFIAGEACKKSNRMFDFDLEHGLLLFKPTKGTKILFEITGIGRNRQRILTELQTRIGKTPISIRFSQDSISLTFERGKIAPIGRTRTLGIDLNPSRIGCSVIEGNQVIVSWYYEISQIRGQPDKRKHELIEILHQIHRKARHYRANIAIEKLNMGSKNHKKGRNFNRLVNNQWDIGLVQQILTKLCEYSGIHLHEVNAAYSSTIGNLSYRLPDPCSAAAEIARRCSGGLFPEFNKLNFINDLNRWNGSQVCTDEFEDWIRTHRSIKSQKLRYRVPLGEFVHNEVRFIAKKSQVVVLNNFTTSYQ